MPPKSDFEFVIYFFEFEMYFRPLRKCFIRRESCASQAPGVNKFAECYRLKSSTHRFLFR